MADDTVKAGQLPLVRYRGELMTARRLRKPTSCWDCRRPIARGEVAYGVFGNSVNRMRRLHVACVARAIAARGLPAADSSAKGQCEHKPNEA